MQLNDALSDGLLFTDSATGEQVVFNYRTFYNIVKGAMVKYAQLPESVAVQKMDSSFIVEKPPTKYIDVAFFTHESEYHWAMLVAYGPSYWLRDEPVSVELPEDYDDWEENYIAQHNLSSSSYEYL